MPDLERLKELQKLPLERKIGFTAARIAEWYKHYDGKVHVSFSGWKDSTVLLYIVRKLFPDVKAMFIDTGLEYPEIRDFVKTVDNVDWVRPEKSFLQVIREYGYPVISKDVSQAIYEYRRTPNGCRAPQFGLAEWGNYVKSKEYRNYAYLLNAPFKISNMCCNVMKKKASKKYVKEKGSYPIIGMLASESFRRQTNWVKHGCNAFDQKEPKSNPLSFWTEQDILQYIKLMDIPIASVYGDIVESVDRGGLTTTGAKRTGCMFCMFGVHLEKSPNRFQRMYYTHPKQWDYCIHRLGLGNVLDYIGVPYEPEIEDMFPGY